MRAEADSRTKFNGRCGVDVRERESLQHPVLYHGALSNNVVKNHMCKSGRMGSVTGTGRRMPWKKSNIHKKEARRAYHEHLHNTEMESGDDPDDFPYTIDGYRKRLEGVDQLVPDKWYEDTICQALRAKYERCHQQGGWGVDFRDPGTVALEPHHHQYTLKSFARSLVMMVLLHYVWLTFGSSL